MSIVIDFHINALLLQVILPIQSVKLCAILNCDGGLIVKICVA